MRLGALQARVFVGFQAVGFCSRELNLVLDGSSLLGSRDGVDLDAEARGLLAMRVDIPFQAGTHRVFAV